MRKPAENCLTCETILDTSGMSRNVDAMETGRQSIKKARRPKEGRRTLWFSLFGQDYLSDFSALAGGIRTVSMT